MNNKQFKKASPTEQSFGRGIEELKKIRMTDAEKSRIFETVLSTPIKSPYMKKVSMFAFVYSHNVKMIIATSLIAVISLGGVTYASDSSLPGDLLYPIKTRVVETTLDVVNQSSEKKIVWEEEKVSRRIIEAEKLAENDELDDERSEELERKIEESSRAFAKAVDEANGGKAPSRKEEFRKKFESKVVEESLETDLDDNKSENKSKVERLRRAAREAVEIETDKD